MLVSVHGIIFSYGIGGNMQTLTRHRTVSSMPFGGRYRLIDFALSNMVNAGMSDVGVIMKAAYQSLMDHLGAGRGWDLNRRIGGLKLLPPFGYADSGGSEYRGRMDALNAVRDYVEGIRQDYVMLSNGNIALNIDLRPAFAQFVDTKADILAICTRDTGMSSPKFNYFIPGEDPQFATDIVCEPTRSRRLSCRSLEIYILSKALLLDLMGECAERKMYSLTADVLQRQMGRLKVGLYQFDGYSAAIHTMQDYYSSNMDLLDRDVRWALFNPERPILTKSRGDTSAYYSVGAISRNSLVADGCQIEGEVENCILFRGVKVGHDAHLKNCILMQDTVIGPGAKLSYVVTDKNVEVSAGVEMTGHKSYPVVIAKGERV